MSVQAMKAGAMDFFTKPFRDQTLIDAVANAIEADRVRRAEAALTGQNLDRYATLTPREREVFRHVVQGRLNKQIAFDLGISIVTVKLHRGSVMRKMGARSVGDLIRASKTLSPSSGPLKS
jgi:FixJ family two-component response regulator